MPRLFVALPLPGWVRQELATIRCGISSARWTPVENYHLTLRFIGEVDGGIAEDLAHALAHVLATIQRSAFPMTVRGVGCFGSRKQSRLLWAGISPSPDLQHLQAKIESAVVRAGLAPAQQKFIPHIALARLHKASAVAVAQCLEAFSSFCLPTVPVDAFALYSSWPGEEGAIYREEMRYRFFQRQGKENGALHPFHPITDRS